MWKLSPDLIYMNFCLPFRGSLTLRGSVDTIYSDNGSTFCAAADVLPKLLGSTEFNNAVRKRGINWVRIPPYAPSQGGSWEAMVKLFDNCFAPSHRACSSQTNINRIADLRVGRRAHRKRSPTYHA